MLEHRWFLSEQAKKDVGIDEAVRAFIESELPKALPEGIVLADPEDDADPDSAAADRDS